MLAKNKNSDEEEEEIDTDLETDRLLGHQMLDDGFYSEKAWAESKQCRLMLNSTLTSKISPKLKMHTTVPQPNPSILRHGLNALLPTSNSSDCCNNNSSSPTVMNASASFHQTRSLKNSPSFTSGNLVNLMHASNEASPERKNDSTSLRNVEPVEEKKEQPTPINSSDAPEHLDNEIVDSPGGSSNDRFKKDAGLSSDKKKKNKNKEGKKLLLMLRNESQCSFCH